MTNRIGRRSSAMNPVAGTLTIRALCRVNNSFCVFESVIGPRPGSQRLPRMRENRVESRERCSKQQPACHGARAMGFQPVRCGAKCPRPAGGGDYGCDLCCPAGSENLRIGMIRAVNQPIRSSGRKRSGFQCASEAAGCRLGETRAR